MSKPKQSLPITRSTHSSSHRCAHIIQYCIVHNIFKIYGKDSNHRIFCNMNKLIELHCTNLLEYEQHDGWMRIRYIWHMFTILTHRFNK